MAAPTTVAARIDRYLSALLAEVADLPNVVAEWDSMPPATRASVALDWDHLLADYLAELDSHYRAGVMLPAQSARYADLRRQPRATLPLLEQLGWLPLPVELTD
jgi:hypothetical protein